MITGFARIALLLSFAIPCSATIPSSTDVPFVLTRLNLDLRVDYEANSMLIATSPQTNTLQPSELCLVVAQVIP